MGWTTRLVFEFMIVHQCSRRRDRGIESREHGRVACSTPTRTISAALSFEATQRGERSQVLDRSVTTRGERSGGVPRWLIILFMPPDVK